MALPCSGFSSRLSLFILNSNKGEYITSIYISPTSKIYFRVHENDTDYTNDKFLEFDVNSKDILRTIDRWDAGGIIFTNFDYYFSPDGRYFIYSDNTPYWNKTGIRKYDLLTLQSDLIIENGYDAIWSPSNKYIAYLQDNRIMLYTIETMESKVLFTPPDVETLRQIYWLPDGNHLYFTTLLKKRPKFNLTRKSIINVESLQVNELTKEEYPKTAIKFYWKN